MSFILVGNNFYYCDSLSDVNYTWDEGVKVFVKGTEAYNGTYYILTGGILQHLADQADLKVIHEKNDTLVSATNIKTINGSSILGSGDLTVTGGLTQQQIEGLI